MTRSNPVLATSRMQFAAAFAILATCATCHGQFSSGGSAAGGGASSFGSGSSLGSSRFGQSGFGTSSFGASSLGQSSLGQSSFGSGASASGFGANTTGQNNAQSFVGRGAADLEAFFGDVGNVVQEVQRQQRARRDAASQSSEVRRPEVRVSLSASPELQRQTARVRPTASVAVATSGRLLQRRGLDRVAITASAGVVTLEGAVASASERLLAEKLVSLEPGVRSVVNNLQVEPEVEEIPALAL